MTGFAAPDPAAFARPHEMRPLTAADFEVWIRASYAAIVALDALFRTARADTTRRPVRLAPFWEAPFLNRNQDAGAVDTCAYVIVEHPTPRALHDWYRAAGYGAGWARDAFDGAAHTDSRLCTWAELPCDEQWRFELVTNAIQMTGLLLGFVHRGPPPTPTTEAEPA